MFIPELDRDKLFERLKYTMKKQEVIQLAESFISIGIEPDAILKYTSHTVDAVGFHSAWVLENMLLPNPEALDYYLPNIIEYIPLTQNESVKRHLTKLASYGINRIVNRKSSRVFEREFWKINLEPLEEVCFKWFVDEKTRPAVKVYCMEILYLLSTRQRWIAEELPHIIENQMTFGSPGIRSKGKTMLKLLRELR
ncbi:MAG: hypothetical protein CVT98_10370 [Bacteroidetes bacterium HGW-Bacteroidetes-15]|nr:MAG: hypothetical protein CVT98_10370 [Bacteroidetes bacterium HGW-Bacteroidetes-15]